MARHKEAQGQCRNCKRWVSRCQVACGAQQAAGGALEGRAQVHLNFASSVPAKVLFCGCQPRLYDFLLQQHKFEALCMQGSCTTAWARIGVAPVYAAAGLCLPAQRIPCEAAAQIICTVKRGHCGTDSNRQDDIFAPSPINVINAPRSFEALILRY